MKTSSAKAKGRSFQQHVAKELLRIGRPFGLVADDITSTSMGASGVAQRLFGNLAIECKNCESLGVTSTFLGHQAKYPLRAALLFHRRNRTEPLVTLTVGHYLTLVESVLHLSKAAWGTLYGVTHGEEAR